MNYRNQIMALPQDERLEAALFVLEELTGRNGANLSQICRQFGLTRSEGEVVLFLNKSSPSVVRKEQIHAALYGCKIDAPDLKIVDVLVHKARTKLPAGLIATLWGQGYYMPVALDLPNTAPKGTPEVTTSRRGAKPLPDNRAQIGEGWSPDEDSELVRMRSNGSDFWAIADELGRTQRGCADRYRKLTGEL